MCEIISISNQKGGVGKTTTTISLGVSLAKMGKRVLLCDIDPQSNLTMALGYEQPDEIPVTIEKLLQLEISNSMIRGQANEKEDRSYILHANGVDFIPSSIELAGFENVLQNTMSRENVLKKFLERHKPDYDYIFLDTLPSLNILTINALNASDKVIIPVQAQYLSLKGLELLLQTISSVKCNLNPNLEIAGIVITMLDKRAIFQKEVIATVEERYGKYIRVFANKISLSVNVSESQSRGVSVFDLKNNKVANDYKLLAEELVVNG